MVNSKSEEEEEEKEWVGEEGRVLDLGWLCVLLPIFLCLHPRPAESTEREGRAVGCAEGWDGMGWEVGKKRGWRKYIWSAL